MIPYVGPEYDLLELRLRDVDAGCGRCGKRLAECIHDPEMRWTRGQLVCIDCGEVATLPAKATVQSPVRINASWRSPGLRVACCTLCPWTSMPLVADVAVKRAQEHLAAKHAA